MNKYFAKVFIDGVSRNIFVFANSSLHAQLIIEYYLGIGSLIEMPKNSLVSDVGLLLDEVLSIKPKKPLTPSQSRIANLKKQKETITKNLKSERDRQKISKAQKQISQVLFTT